MKFELKNRWSGKVLFSAEAGSLKLAVEAAIKSGAVLSEAVLSGADLSGADLSGADLSGADLTGADLRWADLRWAVLSGADLTGADLRNCILESMPTVFDWTQIHTLPMRTINKRTLVMGWRTQNQPHMDGPDYEIGKVYTADVFSRCPVTRCHPGLYVSHEGDMAVAFWLDEAVLAGSAGDFKVRCKRFRTIWLAVEPTAARGTFEMLTEQDMEPES